MAEFEIPWHVAAKFREFGYRPVGAPFVIDQQESYFWQAIRFERKVWYVLCSAYEFLGPFTAEQVRVLTQFTPGEGH